MSRDLHPEIVAGHMALGEAVTRLDCLETRTYYARNPRLYVAEGVPEHIAENVLLEMLAASLGPK